MALSKARSSIGCLPGQAAVGMIDGDAPAVEPAEYGRQGCLAARRSVR